MVTKAHKQCVIEVECLNLAKTAALTGLSVRTWRRYALGGKVGSVKIDKKVLIPVSEIKRVMGEGYRPAIQDKS
jgi:hypothetical protein